MADIVNLQTTLDQKRQELARLEAELKAAQRETLARLPADYGFDSADALIRALAEFASPRMQAAVAGAFSGAPRSLSAPPEGERSRKKRVTVTDDLREQIAAEIKQGTLSANEIAAKFDVSSSTVNQLKQRLGLTRTRKRS